MACLGGTSSVASVCQPDTAEARFVARDTLRFGETHEQTAVPRLCQVHEALVRVEKGAGQLNT